MVLHVLYLPAFIQYCSLNYISNIYIYICTYIGVYGTMNNVSLITQPTGRKPTGHNASLTITLAHPTLPTQVQKRRVTNRDNLTTLRTNTSNLVTIETPDALLNMMPPHCKDPNSGQVTNVNPTDEQPRTNTSDLVTIETPDSLFNTSYPHINDPNSGHMKNATPNNEQPTSDNTIELFYQNQMISCYQQTEKELEKIIHDNIKPRETTSNI